MKLQPAVKKETVHVTLGTGIVTACMVVIFYLLHKIMPESVPAGYRVILAAIIGWFVASLNFFLMAITVQKVTDMTDEKMARGKMTVSLRYRTIMQGIWIVLSIVLPCFNFVAGILPLFFPNFVIKFLAAREKRKNSSVATPSSRASDASSDGNQSQEGKEVQT